MAGRPDPIYPVPDTKRCGTVFKTGLRCDLPKGHYGPHAATVRRS